jgi:hypothetical protein
VALSILALVSSRWIEGRSTPDPAAPASALLSERAVAELRPSAAEDPREATPEASRASEGPAEAIAAPMLVPEKQASRPSGIVSGALLLADGRPVPNAWISFVDPDHDYVVAARSHARSDEHGFYELRIEARRWNAWYLGAVRGGFARPCGSIDVPAGAVVHWDVVLDGTRTLRGELAIAAEDLRDMNEGEVQPLLVEVRRPGDGELLAQGEALTEFRRDELEGAELEDAELEDDRRPPLTGAFAIEALPAQVLELRIVLPGGFRDSVDGKDHAMYLSRTVDLHAGDLVLPREELRMGEFFEATERRLARERR